MLSTVSPAKLNSPCAFMLNKSHFSTIKILSIPASGIPKKCLTFSHKPLWCFSSYRHRHSALGWSLRASPTASSRGKTITSCSVCAEGSQKQKPTHTYTHFFFPFFQSTYPYRSIPARHRVLVNTPAVAAAVGIFKYSSFQRMALLPQPLSRELCSFLCSNRLP